MNGGKTQWFLKGEIVHGYHKWQGFCVYFGTYACLRYDKPMRLTPLQTIYQAVLARKWVDVTYGRKDDQRTRFFICVKDIEPKTGKIFCEVFNPFKSNKAVEDSRDIFIYANKILKASVIDQSFYFLDDSFAKRIESDPTLLAYLGADTFDNNILCYLSDCYKYDNDPYLKDKLVLPGVDIAELTNKGKVVLEEDDFDLLLDTLFKKDRFESERVSRFVDLAINSFSIDVGDKQYVVAYHRLTLDFKNRILRVEEHPTINKSFLVDEDKKITIGAYLDMSPETFCAEYESKKREFITDIEENFNYGEKVNTRPTIFLIERKALTGVDQAFESIALMEKEGTLTQPLKSFFGRNRVGSGTKKDPAIVVFDKTKVNIDQMRVVYNAMVNHVTYVQGPPGTGKTETIFNVVLSAYANDKTVLICSNNNHPIDDIGKRLYRSFQPEGKKDDSFVRFPFIRLGNMEELVKAVRLIRRDLALAQKLEKVKTNEGYTNKTKDRSVESFSDLRELLKQFEERTDLMERIDILRKIKEITDVPKVKEEALKQLNLLVAKLQTLPPVDNGDIAGCMISASEDKTFRDFVYFSSLISLKKLLSPTMQDLRDIVAASDDEAAVQLSKYLKNDKNLRRFQGVYKVILTTNLSAEKLGEATPQFDLCIMDEAGQCNVATSLIPIVRARDLLLVGDTNQLQPVTVIEPAINEKLKAKYSIKGEYDYVGNSILSTMKSKDKNSKSIMLRYHYRCGKKIAGFSNQRFYSGELRLENLTPGELVYVDEAAVIADLIAKNGYKDVGIITPFVNQAELINRALAKKGITDVKAGTIHTLQGSEKSTIIFSAALSTRTAKKTLDWVKNNHELINVGVTRAKERLIFVGDKDAIDAQCKDEVSDIKALSDYVHSEGAYVVPKIEDRSFADFSNDSTSEREFFETVSPYFKKRHDKMKIVRNYPVKQAIPFASAEDFGLIGKKEFDLVVQVQGGMFSRTLKTLVAFEVDGGEHVGSKTTAKRDREKEAVCAKYGIKLIRVANSQVKDYELIVALFECVLKQLPDLDAYEQGSLFGDDDAQRNSMGA
jgi:hypothetical protein